MKNEMTVGRWVAPSLVRSLGSSLLGLLCWVSFFSENDLLVRLLAHSLTHFSMMMS